MRSNRMWLAAVMLASFGGLHAQPAGGRQLIRFAEELGLGGHIRLSAPSDTASLKFRWPESWQAQGGSVLHLVIEHSPELDGDRSFLSVTLNYGILRSVRLDSSNAHSSEITVALPPASIKPENEITFFVEQLAKPAAGAVWTRISPKSFLEIRYLPKPERAALEGLPFSLLGPNPYAPARLAVLAPNKPGSAALEATSLLVAWLILQARPRHVEVRVVDTLDGAGEDPVLIAGTRLEHPEMAKVLGRLPVLRGAASEGVVALGDSRLGGRRSLVVTGNSPDAVLRAARYVSTGGRLSGAVVRVSEVRSVTVEPRAWKNALPLRNGFLLSALEAEEIPISAASGFPTVVDLNPTPDADFLPFGHKATLKLRLNPAYYQPRSVLTVELNGTEVARSKVESIAKGFSASLGFAIPARLLGRVNRLKIEWRSADAVDRHGVAAWLSRESSFYLPRNYSVKVPDLALLRHGLFPFSLLADFSDVVVAVPDPLSRPLLPAIVELAAVIGRASPGHHVSFRVRRISEITVGLAAQSHMLVLHVDGMENPLAAAQAKEKPIPRPPELRGAPAVRESVSPWNPDKFILTVSASSSPGVERAVRQLFTSPLVEELQFDTAYLAGNRVQCHQLEQQRDFRHSSLAVQLEAWLMTYWLSLPVVLTMASALLFAGLRLVLRHHRQ